MNFVWGIVITIHALSFIFMATCLLRAFTFKKRNVFVESKYTLLFGFITIDYVLITYMFFTLLYAIGSMLLILYLSSL